MGLSRRSVVPHFRSRRSLLLLPFLFLASLAWTQTPAKVRLETSETVFSVAAALNACGIDSDLGVSSPLRAQVRAELARAAERSEQSRSALHQLCGFYRDHQRPDASQDLAQYISLALNLGPPPAFALVTKEADLPPDAAYVLGLPPYLQRYYAAARLHELWERHQADYNGLIQHLQAQLANLLLATDVYLRLPAGAYAGRALVIYLEPLIPPGQVNSRSYNENYYMVISPATRQPLKGPEPGWLRLEAIRHTYLHFILDSYVAERGLTMRRLEPLLGSVKMAPMDASYKRDITLLLTESLIRAIEARTSVAGKDKKAEMQRARLAHAAAEEGFILAPYFERQLANFEMQVEGFPQAFPEWLRELDVQKEKNRAARIVFAKTATPEAVRASGRSSKPLLLDEAQQRLAAGELQRARDLAEQALAQNRGDSGRALFILAQVAAQNKDMAGAQAYFERSLTVAREPHVVAWSHIYLGRIFDLRAERGQALQHYRAALAAGDSSAATRLAAEQGIERPYSPPKSAANGAAGDSPNQRSEGHE
jgi:hypothetical protein